MLLYQGRFRIHSTFYGLLPPNKPTVFLNLPPEYCAGTSSTLGMQEGLRSFLTDSIWSQSPQLQDCVYNQSSFVHLINLHEVFLFDSQNWMNLQGHTKGLYNTRYKALYASVIHLHHQRRESFKACPLNTLAHPGQWEQAQAQHVNKINCSCDTH